MTNADKNQESLTAMYDQWQVLFSIASKWKGRKNYLLELDEELEAVHREADQLMQRICSTEAKNVSGIISKLNLVLEWFRLAPYEMEDPPFRCIQSALADLRKLAEQLGD